MKKSDYEMTIGAINYLVERLSTTGNIEDEKLAEEYEKLEKRLRIDFLRSIRNK